MPHAWWVRESWRQDFLRILTGKVRRLEELSELDRWVFVQALVRYLRYREEVRAGQSTSFDCSDPSSKALLFSIVPDIEAFSRAPAEANVMCARLLDWAVQDLTQRFYSELSRAELQDPQTILAAPSAGTDIPLASRE